VIEFADRTFTFEELLEYHGGNSPGGVAHALKVLERALPMLDPTAPCVRQEIVVATAFEGPGARDAFDFVTGCRPTIERALARPERGRAAERFVFRLDYRGRSVTLALRDGFVSDEFIDLARTDPRSPEQEARLTVLKQQMAERVTAAAASEVYEVS
jgi:hypothetical protein